MKPAMKNVHKIRKSFEKKIEMHAQFEKPQNKPKNVTSKLKILKSALRNLKKIKSLAIFCLNFDFRFSNLTFNFQIHLGFTLQTSVSLTFFL